MEESEHQIDILVLTPFNIWVLSYLDGEPGSVFQGRTKNQWIELRSNGEKPIDNPLVSLNRHVQFLRQLLRDKEIEATIKVGVIAPTSFIEFVEAGRGVQLVDQTSFASWVEALEPYRTPIKHRQIQTLQALLRQTVTKADNR